MSEPNVEPDQEHSGQTDEEPDAGEPIAALAQFDEETTDGLVARIRRTIHRRATTVQLLTFSWTVPRVVLTEFWLMLIEQTNRSNSQKDGR